MSKSRKVRNIQASVRHHLSRNAKRRVNSMSYAFVKAHVGGKNNEPGK